jgi:hypothetical protein
MARLFTLLGSTDISRRKIAVVVADDGEWLGEQIVSGVLEPDSRELRFLNMPRSKVLETGKRERAVV